MKYKVSKEMPFVKIGTLLAFTESEIVIKTEGDHTNYYFLRKELDNLITEGWIEEVKPEVFWINKYRNGDIFIYFKEDQARQNFKNSLRADKEKTMKVIEVIE